MKVNVWNTILQLSKERGVEPSVIVHAIEESLLVASSKYFTHNEKIKVHFKPEKGELRVFALKRICENPKDLSSEISYEDAKRIDITAKDGNYIEIDLPSETLGRIAAQAAKQVILQKVRDAEQEKIYHKFAQKLGDIVMGVIRRFESNKNMIIEFDKTEILLPIQEKLYNEEFRIGDRVRAVIKKVLKDNKGSQVIVSRTDPKFLYKLFFLEIPEIANGNIIIKNIVRQPGERAKVAVLSKEKDIDPIGACIGVKGNRILAISKELQGEKIDVIEWSDNPIAYAKTALSPAKVNNAFILNKANKTMQIVVPNNQLSLAIGKKGINVRLASRLIGWRLEIKSQDDDKPHDRRLNRR